MTAARNLAWTAIGVAMMMFARTTAWADDGAWQVHRDADQMTDQVTASATRMFVLDRGVRARATASCASGLVNFAFEMYGSGNAGLRLEWNESETYSGTTFGFSTQLSRNVKQWVNIRVRIDSQEVQQHQSNSKNANEVEIVFYDPRELKAAADAQAAQLNAQSSRPQQGQSRQQSMGDFMSGLNQALGAMVTQSLPTLMPLLASGTVDQLKAARNIRVEVPLDDGRTPIITFSPAERGLQAFLSDCGGAGATSSFEGVFASGPSMKLIFKNGQVVVQSNGKFSPPATYRVSGNHVVVTDPNQETHQFDMTADGGLQLSVGQNLMRFTRVQ